MINYALTLSLGVFVMFSVGQCNLREPLSLPSIPHLPALSTAIIKFRQTSHQRNSYLSILDLVNILNIDEKTGFVTGFIDFAEIPEEEEHEERVEFGSARFWMISLCSLALTLFAGLMSGLTVGYLSIDTLVLELKLKNGTEEEKKNALKILTILENQHHLLVTLLVANAAAMEALPLCLNLLVSEIVAVIISVTAVLIFGEIIPQAVCTGPSQLKIASKVAPLTMFLMMIESIIAFPLGKLLDIILGEHGKSRYHNTDLKALIELHSENALKDMLEENDAEEGLGLSLAQTKLINGTIDLVNTTAQDVMTPYDQVAAVSDEQIMDADFIKKLNSMGYSRFPVYKGSNKHQVMGMLLIKKLVGVAGSDKKLSELNIQLRKPLIIPPTMCLTDLLAEFQKGKSHMALVTSQTASVQKYLGLDEKNSIVGTVAYSESILVSDCTILGIVTLENVIEKAMGGAILDEADYDKSQREKLGRGSANKEEAGKVRRLRQTVVAPKARRLFVESLLQVESNRLHEIVKGESKNKSKDDKKEPNDSNDKFQPLLNN